MVVTFTSGSRCPPYQIARTTPRCTSSDSGLAAHEMTLFFPLRSLHRHVCPLRPRLQHLAPTAGSIGTSFCTEVLKSVGTPSRRLNQATAMVSPALQGKQLLHRFYHWKYFLNESLGWLCKVRRASERCEDCFEGSA